MRSMKLFRQRDVFIIVPVFNEEKIIKKVLIGIKKKFTNIICIDDGSSDNSHKLILKLKVTCLKHDVNLGQGAAIQTGITYAIRRKAKYFVTFDSDGQHSIDDVEKMLKLLINKKKNIILGSRFLDNNSPKKIPILRRIVLKFAVKISNFFYGLSLTDTHNGLRVFDYKYAKTLNIKLHGMSHPSDFIVNIIKRKLKFLEYPTNISYSKYSIAKGQSNINSFNILFDMLISRLRKY